MLGDVGILWSGCWGIEKIRKIIIKINGIPIVMRYGNRSLNIYFCLSSGNANFSHLHFVFWHWYLWISRNFPKNLEIPVFGILCTSQLQWGQVLVSILKILPFTVSIYSQIYAFKCKPLFHNRSRYDSFEDRSLAFGDYWVSDCPEVTRTIWTRW